MSVINNVLRNLESRESHFTPIDFQSVELQRARSWDPKPWILGGLALLVVALGAWYLLPPLVSPAAPLNPLEAVRPPPPVMASSATVPNQIFGLQIRESEREMRLEFALRERVVAFLQERGENRFTYRLRDIESEIAAPRLQDNRFIVDLEIDARDDGVDIGFVTVPGILVETAQSQAGDERIWAIDLRLAEPAQKIVAATPAPVAKSSAVAAPPTPVPEAPAPAVAELTPVAPAESPAVVELVTTSPAPLSSGGEVRLDIRSTNPNADSDNRLDYAVTLINSGRYRDAEALLRTLLDGNADYQARRHLLALYARRQQPARLRQLAQESTARYADDAGFRGEYGRALLQQGAYRAVIDLFAGRDRLDAGQHALLAVSHQRLDQHADAIRYYRLALAQEPNNARNWIGLGISQEQASALGDALDSYRNAALLGNLNPRLQAFVAKRTDSLQRVLN